MSAARPLRRRSHRSAQREGYPVSAARPPEGARTEARGAKVTQ